MTDTYEKRALVTGGAQGLGKALVDALLADGWSVISIDVQAAKSEVPRLEQIQCDLSDHLAVDQLMKDLKAREAFDLVILNAAVSATGKFETIPLDVHEKLLRLNAQTPMVMAAGLASGKRLKPDARLVFVSSLSHFTGYPGAASYAASKDAIAIYAKSIRKPFARLGVKVCCVFPGPMRTEQAEKHAPEGAKAEDRMLPEVAAAEILKGVAKGAPRIIPGGRSAMFAWAGRIAPFLTDRAMRRIIHEKLDRDVY